MEYRHGEPDNLEALDFTSSPKRGIQIKTEPIDTPVLDLSCKKQSSMLSDCPQSSFESRSNSPESDGHQQLTSLSESERKSPFEGRTFMVTPPSETDSPKKTKYEPIYNHSTIPNNNNNNNNNVVGPHPGFSVLPMNLPLPVVPTMLPALLAQNSPQINQINHIPVSGSPPAPASYPIDSGMTTPDSGKKAPRPFKAYPKDPLSLTVGTAELIYDQNSNEAYTEFRKRMLESVKRSNEGTNAKMRRVTKSPGLPTSTMDEKDAAYWERRRKNNEAAKRSRDARRAKEDEIAIRAAFLEQENLKLKYELVALRTETAKLRCMVYST